MARRLTLDVVKTGAGAGGAFAFIAAAMAVVVISVGMFGPRTQGLSLEAISR